LDTLTAKRTLRDRLAYKLKIASSSTKTPRASESPVANVSQAQPHLIHASQTTSESKRSSTTDSTEPTNHVAPPKESVPTSVGANTETERHDRTSLSPPNPKVGTDNPVPQAKNQATRTQDGLVRSVIETPDQTDQTEIQHVDLWDRAYEMLGSRDKSLMEKYEKILDDELRASISSKAVFGAVTSVGM
jgi:hypothetical protein